MRNIFFLFFLTIPASASMPELLQAIERQDIPVIQQSIKGRSFTDKEKSILVDKVNEVRQKQDKKAWITSENKESCWATACLALIGAACIALEPCLKMCGTEVNCFKVLASLSGEEKKYFASHALCSFALILASIFAGYDCLEGYYTDKPRYIKSLLMKEFGYFTYSWVVHFN